MHRSLRHHNLVMATIRTTLMFLITTFAQITVPSPVGCPDLRIPIPASKPTITNEPSASSPTLSPTIYTKIWAPDCAVQGSATVAFLEHLYLSYTFSDILQCQTMCQVTGPCVSYSWDSTAIANNCVAYDHALDIQTFITRGETGVFFSSKNAAFGLGTYPGVCYSDAVISSPTLSSFPLPTPSIYVKDAVDDCNLEGSVIDTVPVFGTYSFNDVLACQYHCVNIPICISYSWDSRKEEGNCVLYGDWVSPLQAPGNFIPGHTGVVFSDHNVDDGTEWCYSAVPAPAPINHELKRSVTATSTSPPIITKTSVADCAVEGTAGAPLSEHIFGTVTASDVLDCQYQCRYTTACISYAWNTTTQTDNCAEYNAWDNVAGAVIPGNDTGVWFSDKYPEDGSDFCYFYASASSSTLTVVPSTTSSSVSTTSKARAKTRSKKQRTTTHHEKPPSTSMPATTSMGLRTTTSTPAMISSSSRVRTTGSVSIPRGGGLGPRKTSSSPLKSSSSAKSKTTSKGSATSTASSTTTASPSKTSVPDCNFQGLPGYILNYTITSIYVPDVLTCQDSCEAITNTTLPSNFTGSAPDGCLSYAYRAPAGTSFENCEMFDVDFNITVDGTPLVIKDLVSGIWYSNRWPSDGSGFCYS